MPPTVHIVRHAQGHHNVAKFGDDIHDPFLTEEGQEQARELCRKFTKHDQIDLLMASPMKRTIQTCRLAFEPCVDRGMTILLEPLAQESSETQMDTGSTTESIVNDFGDLVDTQRLEVHPYWHRNNGRFGIEGDTLIERGRLLRTYLRSRPEENIALVSHGTFAHYLVGNVDKSGEEQTTRMWANTEIRAYTFVSDDDELAVMQETAESKENRPDLEKKGSGYVLSSDGPRRNSAGAAISP